MKLAAAMREPVTNNVLRSTGRIPAVVYNKELNVSISVNLREFDRVFRAAGSSGLIDLDIDGTEHSVLVKAVQMNKRRRVPQHVDFYAVTAGQKVQVGVGLNFEGTPAGVRDGGQLDVQRREVLINIVPRLIPSHLDVDVSGLAIGDSLHISDLVALLPDEAEVIDDLELAIVAVVPPRIAAEAEETGEESAEPEVIGESAAEAEGAEE